MYGKGGIGKSTTSSNVSAVFGKLGLKVLQIGCDPKADSTKNLLSGSRMSSVLNILNTNSDATVDQIVAKGFAGVFCLEAGGPEPGIGCAGRGIISVIETIQKLDLFEKLEIDIVIYDVLGDVVCGGFAVPLRMEFAKEVYLITSGEVMALYAANNIAKAIKRFGMRNDVRLGGIICNCRNAYLEKEKVLMLAANLGTEVISWIPRDNIVQEYEMQGKTIIEGAPESAVAETYKRLAEHIVSNDRFVVPMPMSDDDFDRMVKISPEMSSHTGSR